MNKLLFAFAVAAAVSVPARAAGPDGGGPALFGRFKPVVGAWAEYDFTKTGGKRDEKGTMRMAIVDKEGDDFWMEMKIKMEGEKAKKGGMENAVMKMLVSKDPSKPRRMLMKTDRGVMEMNVSGRKPSAIPSGKDLKESGKEKVKVPAGEFDATVMLLKSEKESGKVWVKEGVGPYGVIKQESTSVKGETNKLVLLSYGDGAKPEVDVSKAMKMPSFGAMGAEGPQGGGSGMGPGGAPGGMPSGMNDMIQKAMQRRMQKKQEQGE